MILKCQAQSRYHAQETGEGGRGGYLGRWEGRDDRMEQNMRRGQNDLKSTGGRRNGLGALVTGVIRNLPRSWSEALHLEVCPFDGIP